MKWAWGVKRPDETGGCGILQVEIRDCTGVGHISRLSVASGARSCGAGILPVNARHSTWARPSLRRGYGGQVAHATRAADNRQMRPGMQRIVSDVKQAPVFSVDSQARVRLRELPASMASSFPLSRDPFRPTWRRVFMAVAVAAAAFLMPQEAPLVFYPLNNPSPGTLLIQITCASTVTGNARFYLDTGQGYNERETIAWPIAPSARPYTYTFPLSDSPLYGLRIDPFDAGPGEFTITNLRIIERHGKEIRRFSKDDFAFLHNIEAIVPLSGGWKFVVADAGDPYASMAFPSPLLPKGMNTRNLQRCLLSWGYLALMLWILLLAVYFSLIRARPLRETFMCAAFMAGIALLFAGVGNRGLFKESVRSARFHPPPVKAGLSLEFDLTVDHPSPAQLFWDTGAGFNEKQSTFRNYEPNGQLQRLLFPLPAEPIRALRFDPLTAEGRLVVHRIRVVDQDGRTRLIVPFTALHAARQIAAIEKGTDNLMIRTVPGANDPILEFSAEEVNAIAAVSSGR